MLRPQTPAYTGVTPKPKTPSRPEKRMPSRWPILAVAAAIFSAGCLAAHFASHRDPPLILRESRPPGSAIGARLDHGKACVSWQPRTPYRPPWAGQVTRLGVRYTRWSDGSAEVGL